MIFSFHVLIFQGVVVRITPHFFSPQTHGYLEVFHNPSLGDINPFLESYVVTHRETAVSTSNQTPNKFGLLRGSVNGAGFSSMPGTSHGKDFVISILVLLMEEIRLAMYKTL